jgi:hypothetical protein
LGCGRELSGTRLIIKAKGKREKVKVRKPCEAG